MGGIAILFKKNKTMLERENIVANLIKSCETLDETKLETVIQDNTSFETKEQLLFLTAMKTVFKHLRGEVITTLTTDVSFCNLCFFKEEIVTFFCRSGKARFTLLFNTDEGYVKDITLSTAVIA